MRYALAFLILTTACNSATLDPDAGLGGDSSLVDAGQDADVDASADAAVEAGPKCACTSGACCDGCNVRAAGVFCGTGVHTAMCSDATNVEDGMFYQTCDGVTATGCGGAWALDPSTAQHQDCRQNSSTSSCVRRSATFPWGACCSSATCP